MFGERWAEREGTAKCNCQLKESNRGIRSVIGNICGSICSVFLFPVSLIVWDAPLIWGPLKCPCMCYVWVCACTCTTDLWASKVPRAWVCVYTCRYTTWDMCVCVLKFLCCHRENILYTDCARLSAYLLTVNRLWSWESFYVSVLCRGPRLGQARGKQPWRSLGPVSRPRGGVLINFR